MMLRPLFPLILAFLTMLFGCGKTESQNELELRLAAVKPNLNYIRQMNAEEVNIALRICYALKTKRINFKADLNGATFNNNSLTQKCDSSQVKDQFLSTLEVKEDGDLNFLTDYKGVHLTYVPTDINSPMEFICSKLFQGNIPDNTFQKTEFQRIQFEFSKLDNVDVVNIHNGMKDPKNQALDGYLTNYVTIYEIETFPANPQMTGVIKRYHQVEDCSLDGKKKIITLETSLIP